MRMAIANYTLSPTGAWTPSLLPQTGEWEERATEEVRERKFVALLSEEAYAQLRHEWSLHNSEPNGGAITEYGPSFGRSVPVRPHGLELGRRHSLRGRFPFCF